MAINNFGYLIKIGAATSRDHLVTPSGRHATMSFTKYKLYRSPRHLERISKNIAQKFSKKGIQVVVGVSFGGAILSQSVARNLGKKKEVLSFYLENQNNNYLLRDKSNLDLIKNKKILLVDDALDTGKTIKKASIFIKKIGGNVIGAAIICSRNNITSQEVNIPLLYSFSWYDDRAESYSSKNCLLCKKGVPISKDFGVGT